MEQITAKWWLWGNGVKTMAKYFSTDAKFSDVIVKLKKLFLLHITESYILFIPYMCIFQIKMAE